MMVIVCSCDMCSNGSVATDYDFGKDDRWFLFALTLESHYEQVVL